MFLNCKFFRNVIACLIVIGVVTSVSFASSTDIKSQMESVQADITECQNTMDTAHSMAECARALGLSENSDVILVAKQHWNEANEQKKLLMEKYNTLNDLYKNALKEEENNNKTLIGTFRISHYCSGSCCNGGYTGTALGTAVTSGRTIAVDPSVIPLGSTVYIEGYGYRVAEDTGGAIKGNKIDVAVGSHSEAMSMGIKYCKVYIVK